MTCTHSIGIAKSPRAYKRFHDLTEMKNRQCLVVRSDQLLAPVENSSTMLTRLEVQVFDLDPKLFNALAYAHLRYTDFIGSSTSEFSEFRDEERAAFPRHFLGETVYSLDSAVSFMALSCGLARSQTVMFVCRTQSQWVRGGFFVDDWDSEPCSFGRVSEQSPPLQGEPPRIWDQPPWWAEYDDTTLGEGD